MRYKDLINRTIFTIIMVYAFLSGISVGLLFALPLVLLILCTIFSEITRINKKVWKERQLPSVQIIQWYFCAICTAYATLHNIRVPMVNSFPATENFFNKLPFFGFSLGMVGVMGFVLSLRRGMYRYQFIQLTWAAMTLLFTVSQCGSEISNMMRGMVWFLLPVSCVISNDTWAYIFGKLFGRTQLLALSPKKTVEGFVGAFLFTVIWAFWFCGFLSFFPEMYCPVVGFTNTANVANCKRDPLFVQEEVAFPRWVQTLSGNSLTTFLVSPAQKHAIVLGIFASAIAPFGGFFASGLKRAFKLKDFGELIPGHGGMTDRMDCQGIMGLFTYFYLRTYVYGDRCPSVDNLSHCVLAMSVADRQALLVQISESLM